MQIVHLYITDISRRTLWSAMVSWSGWCAPCKKVRWSGSQSTALNTSLHSSWTCASRNQACFMHHSFIKLFCLYIVGFIMLDSCGGDCVFACLSMRKWQTVVVCKTNIWKKNFQNLCELEFSFAGMKTEWSIRIALADLNTACSVDCNCSCSCK